MDEKRTPEGTGPATRAPDAETKPATEGVRPPLSPAAERALAEAAERRRQLDEAASRRARELGGRGGPDPVRYGDWENGGIASDF